MKIQSLLLAAAATVALAAPAAAFAQSWNGADQGRAYAQNDRYGQDSGYDRGGQDNRYGNGHHDRDGWRRIHCRRGVFYMRSNACSNDYGRDRHDGRYSDHHFHDDGSDHRRWR